MTILYFVRYASANFHTHNDLNRELTSQGL